MKIILSPAKKMNIDTDSLSVQGMPKFIDRTEVILSWLRSKTNEELKKLWGCNDKITEQNIKRLEDMDLRSNLTPAVLSYEGIAYQYMAPAVFEDGHFEYVQEHLRILSAFYGVLKPMDGVTPYRLEMQARAAIDGAKNLYDFWGRSLYDAVRDESGIIINLASKEYSKCIEAYLTPEDRYITITFCEKAGGKTSDKSAGKASDKPAGKASDNSSGASNDKSAEKLVTKGTYAKMARGEVVRYMAEKHIEDPAQIQNFDRLGYVYRSDLSSETEYVFERVGTTI